MACNANIDLIPVSTSKQRFKSVINRNINKSGDVSHKNYSKCGRKHGFKECPAYGKTCNKCKKANHFANQCKSRNEKVYAIDSVLENATNTSSKQASKQISVETKNNEN